MPSTIVGRDAVVMLLSAIAAAWAPAPTGAKGKPLLTLRAVAVNMSNVGRPGLGTIDIVIERWSTDEERQHLHDVLVEKGSDALLSALRAVKPRVGYIRPSSGLGWDIEYARERPFGDGGRRVIIATDRPMSVWELVNRPPSAEYGFTLAEIRLSKDGKGTGKLVTAAKITWNEDERTVEIENYASEPVRLTEVTIAGGRDQ